MTRFFVKRVHNELVPADEESVEEMDKLPHGKLLEVTVKYRRSNPHSSLYWMLCKRLARSMGMNHERVSDRFKIETGRYTQEHIHDIDSEAGHWVLHLDSIAFSKMDQTEFNDFFRNCVEIATTKWEIPYESLADLLEENHGPNE
jgi:hypothetical protein